MSDTSQAVFLSYASQDKEAAKRICDALRAAGLEVWFDVSELRGGDAWDAKIRKQIKDCALFVPIISATTNARPEGYFRLEWKLAVDRSHLLADDHPFLFPIVIGDVADTTARVPEKFREVQWTRLRLDETPAELAARIARLLAGNAAGLAEADPGPAIAGKLRKRKDERAAWLKYAWSIVGLGFAVYYLLFNPLAKRLGPKHPRADKPGAEDTAVPEDAKKAIADANKLMESLIAKPPLPGTGQSDKSVAVLAFANLSDDKANEYFSDGISEELLNVLAKIPNLKVAARTSAFYFKGKEVPVPEIARQLGVAYVIEGSVRKSGDKVRITAQLIKASDGFHVWSDTFTRDLKDIFGVQDEIAGLIAKNLELKMGFLPTAKETISTEAYQEYLLGRAAVAKASMADLREAVTHFSKAVALEPKYTPAWVQLATAHTQLGRWGGTPPLQAWAAARLAIDHARALEPESPDVLLALGWILRTGEWNWRGAEQAYRRALELRPNHPDTLSALAVLLFNLDRKIEAFQLGQEAARLDPLNASTQIDLSLMFYFSENWPEAEHTAHRALQLAPEGTGYHAILSWSLALQDRYAEAETEIAKCSDLIDVAPAKAMLAIKRQQPGEIRRWRDQLAEFGREHPGTADLDQSVAWASAALGENDVAFAALARSVESHDPSVSWLRNNWPLRPLEKDPRWQALLHQVGLADDQLK